MEKDAKTNKMQVKLEVGQVSGVAKGAEFAIYPRNITDLKNKENRGSKTTDNK